MAKRSGAAKAVETLQNFDGLPDAANVRKPVVEALFGVSGATVWRWSSQGLLPKPQRLGRCTVWNVGQLRAVLAQVAA